MMDIKTLACVSAIARGETLRHLSKTLALTQPALTVRLQRLEDELGFRIFDRISGRFRLTEQGRQFLPHAERLIAQSDVALRSAARIKGGAFERLDLGLTFIATMARVPEALKRLSDSHPALQLCVHEGLSSDLEQAVLSGAVDLAVLHTPVTTTGIETVDAFREPYRLLMPKGHRLASQPSVRVADLDGEKLILTSRDVGPVIYDRLISMCRDAGVEPVVPHEMTTSLAVARMVSAGFGLGLAIGSAASVARDRVVALPIEGDVPELVFALCHRPGASGHYASALLGLLQDQQSEQAS